MGRHGGRCSHVVFVAGPGAVGHGVAAGTAWAVADTATGLG